MENKSQIAILGYGTEGKDTVKYLLDKKIFNITVFDKKKLKDLDIKGIDVSKIKFITGKNYLRKGLTNFKTIFRSPGVYRYIPEILDAERNGSKITSNVDLFFDSFRGITVGVTGTKGKGTTSTLIYEILKTSGKRVFLSGNIGSPPLSLLNSTNKNSIMILELSSFQLIDVQKSPDIAVILNITSDHMDWHKNRNEYIDSKRNIVKFQNINDYKVINYDYETPRSFATLSISRNYYFSKKINVNGVFVKNKTIYSNINNALEIIGPTDNLLLRGEHNWENVCAALCAAQILGADIESIKKAVFSFKGLEHRLEFVREYKGVSFYNDSFSTNPQTSIAAVNSFKENITLILGGYDKGLDFKKMAKYLSKKKNILNIILIGDVEKKLYKLLKKYTFGNFIFMMGKSKMSEIVEKSLEISKKGSIVLLSPACASFDMFEDYKDRGNQFKDSVKDLL